MLPYCSLPLYPSCPAVTAAGPSPVLESISQVSFIGDKKSLLLLHYLEEPAKDPIELTFKPAYGKLLAHEW